MMQLTEKHFEKEFKDSADYIPSLNQTRNPEFKGSKSLTHKWKNMDFS